MQNIDIKVKGDQLTITVNLKAPAIPSSTGKTLLIASTRGAQDVAHPTLSGLKVAVNIMVPA